MNRDSTRDAPPQVTRWPVILVMLAIALLLAAALLMATGWISTPAARAQPAAAVTDGLAPKSPWTRPDSGQRLSRIAFGSCLDQNKPQPIWKAVLAKKPDVFLMIGDNVYGDIKSPDRRELIEAYRVQAAQPDLASARAAVPFLATWDDHDYGLNDGGANFAHRQEAAEIFRAFWQLPEAKGGADGGIYYSRIVGPIGSRVQVVMLDTRSFRSDLTPRSQTAGGAGYWGRYQPDSTSGKTMLGETQWSWLEAELAKPAEIRLLVSSIQVIAEGHNFERWGNLPREQERLTKLIATTGAKGVILLSGDRHVGALYKQPSDVSYPLVEFTSSSLNRPYGPSKDGRIAPLVSDVYHPENFGVIDIDWTRREVALQLHGLDGQDVGGLRIAFKDLGHPR